jgi:cell fate regulator YaaT (PSP1 superfamily)
VNENDQDRRQKDAAPPKGRCTGAVRYGYMNHIGEFTHPESLALHCEDAVVVQTDRGIELGKYVSYTCPRGGLTQIEREQMERYVANSGPDYMRPRAGRILRVANEQDLEEHRRIVAQTKEKMQVCDGLVKQHGLDMKLVACEHVFGGERIIFYFLSEERVDFRELVKDLAREYQTRIEMRQVGARDEARLVADYEICGRECCCKNFLKTLRPVNMKMAKLQKATLDPTKVSGRCGRLRCCLRYEHESYQELVARLPRMNAWISSEHGTGKVVDRQVITQLVQIELSDGRRVAIGVEEIDEILPGPPPRPTQPEPGQAKDKAEAPPPRRRPPRRRGRGNGASSEQGTPDPGTGEGAKDDRGSKDRPPPAEKGEGKPAGQGRPKSRRRRRGRRKRSGGNSGGEGGIPNGGAGG